MNPVSWKKTAPVILEGEMKVWTMLDENTGCQNGSCAGITDFFSERERVSAVHGDQEGVFVLEGGGTATVGQSTFPIRPGDAFLVPPGEFHSIAKGKEFTRLRVFWFQTGAL